MFCGGPLSPESVISWPRMGGNSPSGTVCQEVTSVLKRLRDPLLLLDRLEPAAPANGVGHVAVAVREDRRVRAVLAHQSSSGVFTRSAGSSPGFTGPSGASTAAFSAAIF